jgi:hypothetical protein
MFSFEKKGGRGSLQLNEVNLWYIKRMEEVQEESGTESLVTLNHSIQQRWCWRKLIE